MDKPTPRVNQSLLSKYQGQQVRLVGRLKSVSGQTALVEAADGGQVTVHLMRDLVSASAVLEFIGQVNPDLSLREMWSTGLGDNFDMTNYNDLVLLSQKFPNLFG